MNRIKILSLVVAAFLLLVALFSASPAAATHVTPTVVGGNPNCAGLGYDFGFKPSPEPPPSGTYFFGDSSTSPPHASTGDSVTITSDGTFFDWSSTLGLDAVIVKGGQNSNVYVYDPPSEEFSDTGLHSPINLNNNQPFAISHIEFCYDFELSVSKTAETSFTRTFGWTIDKSVTPATWDLFSGDSGTSEYTVAVTKDAGTDSDWAVSGTITIANDTPFSATITSVSDVVSGVGSVTVDCGDAFPYVLASGGTLTCSYSTALPDGSDRVNTATVSTSGQVGGGEATADVTFGNPTTLVNDSINVSDSYAGNLGSFNGSGSTSYERTFSCDADEGTHDNTATIVETGQSDGASVTVNCYALEVTKDAATSFTRTWDWTIDKSADQSDLLLSDGQLFLVNYTVDVDASATDSDYAVSGDIWIANPNPSSDATLTGVSDLVSPNLAATVNCPSLTVPAGGSLQCTYSTALPDATSRTNTATATLQNYDYDKDGNATAGGTTDFSGSADVTFSSTPSEEIDDCADLSDTNIGFLGTLCATSVPASFQYGLSFGKHPDADVLLVCGDNSHVNTAVIVTNDTGATVSDTWTVNSTVSCDLGCTLTPGYWKTHSREGPAPYDDTWALLDPDQEDTTFFLSGQTYYQVAWTPPRGNAYYILAHAYIAARLNQLNGASIPSSVLSAYNQATSLLNTYTPAQVGSKKGSQPPRPQFIQLAGILDGYNNGLTGPGHCSE